MIRTESWYVIATLAIVLNAIAMFTQAGIFGIVCGIIWCGVWGWLAFWEIENKRRRKQELLECIRQNPEVFLASDNITSTLRGCGVSAEEAGIALRGRDNSYIGDVDCKHNARSSYLRCAINPYGPCEGCGDFEKFPQKP